MTKVSIIVPVYNTEKYLKKCIDSMINQTEKDIEIIVINDGSKDNADDIIKSFVDKRIKYIKKDNEGIGKTRNIGIKAAEGEYLMFIDSDDYIENDCIEKMYKKSMEDNLDILVSNFYEDRNNNITEVKLETFKTASLKEDPTIINKINLGPCNKIYKRDLIVDNNILFEEKLKYEDAPFVVKAFIKAQKIGKLDEALSHYVIHEKSETTIRDKRMFDIIEITKIIIVEMQKYNYLRTPLINIATMILTDYTIQQRYINDKKTRNKFIDTAFNTLDDLNKCWRKCEYLKKFPIIKRFFKTNRTLTKIYCNLYNLKNCFKNK